MFDPLMLAALAAVVEEGGFEPAAARLSVTQSAVSQRIRALEDRVGAPVVTRTRPPRATAPGRALLRHWVQWTLVAQSLDQSLAQVSSTALPASKAVSGHRAAAPHRITVGVNSDSLATWLVPALSEFARAHRVVLSFLVDDQDHTLDLMRDGAAMACVSTAWRALQGASAVQLGAIAYRCVCSPAFKQHYFPKGLTASNLAALNLAQVPAVVFNEKDDMHHDFLSSFAGVSRLTFPFHRVPSSESFVRAIVAGWGYGMVPENQIGEALRKGTLIDLAPKHAMPVMLYWHRWQIRAPLLDALSDAVLAAAQAGFVV
jgi:LysR family transcriptional regulator, chromosome initiation inhibitor